MRVPGRVARAQRPLLDDVQDHHPGVLAAIAADARLAAAQRGDRTTPAGRWARGAQALHLVWATDAFGALALYRIRAGAQRRRLPVVPRLAHRLAVAWAQVTIGDPCRIQPGVLLPHGQVVIDGFVEIGTGTRIRPFVTIGLLEGGLRGPTIGRDVRIGTGAKVLGPITVGDGATIGANAVVLHDVAAGTTVVGSPARPVGGKPADAPEASAPTGP